MNLKLNNYSYLTPSPAVLDGLDYLPDAGNKPSRGRSSIIIIEKVGKYCSSHQLESIDCTICTICTICLPDGVAGDDDDDDVDAHPGYQNLSLPDQFLSKYSSQNITTIDNIILIGTEIRRVLKK